MGEKSIRINYIYNVAYQILNILIPLITTPYVSRVLSAEGIGRYSFSSSIVSYFVLFATLGTSAYGQREISYTQKDRARRRKLLWEIDLFSCFTTAIAVLAYVMFLLLTGMRLIYIIQILSLLAAATDITWLYSGVESFKTISIRNAVFKIVNVIFIFGMVRSEKDFMIYVFGLCGIQFLSTVTLWMRIQEIVDWTGWKNLNIVSHLRGDLELFVPTIAIQIYTVLDKTMIGLITGSDAANGYYEQAMRISKVALTLITALGTVMVPRMGAFYADNDKALMQDYMMRSFRFVWLMGVPLCFGLIGISDNLIPWFLGPGFMQSISLLRVLSLLIVIIGISNITGTQYMVPTKRQNQFSMSVCLGAVVNFFCNLLLIREMGALGAAIASVIAEITVSGTQLFMVRKEINILEIIHKGKNYLFAGTMMLILLRWEAALLVPSCTHTCIMIITGAVIYVLVLCTLRDEFLLFNLRSLSELIVRKRK